MQFPWYNCIFLSVLLNSDLIIFLFAGQIPSSFCNLRQLSYINLIGNSFECYPDCLSSYFMTHADELYPSRECIYDTSGSVESAGNQLYYI